ncbi:MAG: bifunctional diguanylate cyclase/phosphodiesterase [Acidimicrobiia bacterium]|nr:bifunctional diguanylate cyclase/phosphodiesterase [Acidimicrobiia bacterium]
MRDGGRAHRSVIRLFGVHAALSIIPVLVLGGALAFNFKAEAQRRGLRQGEAQAALVAQTAVEPLFPLGQPLSKASLTDAQLQALIRLANDPAILRLRLHDMAGNVVFSVDASGQAGPPEPDAVEAAKGAPVARLTHLNTDTNDEGPSGVSAVEIYRAVVAGDPAHRIGVLEIYLPYGPISQDVTSSLNSLYRDLAIGLGALYLTLLVISISVSRGLRQEVAFNAFLAEHDNLTDLPNRTLFHRRAEAALKRAKPDDPVAIAIIDLDRFKDVNDTLGHHNGDRLLSELARRLDVNTRPEDTVARLGGDEFGVVLTGVTDAEEALWRLRDVIDREVEVSGLPLSVESSVGYVVAPADGIDVDDLLQRADVAMYVAKGAHSGVVRYDPEQDDYDAAKLGLIAELRHAIDDGQLLLHYQPKASIRTGRVEAMEALVRWNHPARGLLYPDSFIPIAEQTDLIDKLTHWALARALDDLRDLGRPSSKLAVAVNVSARSLSKPDFAWRVQNALQRAGVPPTRLIIEITETALITDPERAGVALANLDAAGVRVSIDDFGQGQTSLGYLSNLAVHELKIDKSFVSDMLTNPAHAAIVRSIVDLGHNLDMRVVGEGVETEEVLEGLRDAGCDVAQGYLLARPMALDQLEDWLHDGGHGDKPRRRPLTVRRRVPVA